MSDLFKSALSYIGSSTSSSNNKGVANNSSASQSAPNLSSLEVIKLSGENVRILKLIAEGGSSYVYGGQFASTGEIIAVKKIPCQADMEDRILGEIKFMNGFNHRNIAKYFGYNKINNTYWIGLEYCSALRTPLREDLVGLVFGHIVSGVDYMHQQGITHWDLKIENCMLGRDGMIKLIDFGSANTASYETSNLTSKERNQMEDELMRFTTPMYRPPEVLDLWSGIRIDYHVDLWALGCILYYLANSEHPFSDSNKLAIINCKYAKRPSIFSKIIEGLLVINPEGRWTLGGVLHELESMGIDVTAAVPLNFEEFQMPIPAMAANAVQASSLLNSIKGGAESWFKNIKESSSRIYSAQSTQPPPRPESGPHMREVKLPQRPPPPKPAPPKSPVSRPPPPRQLTGENEPQPPPRPQPATAFDLISDIEPARSSATANEPVIGFDEPHSASTLLDGFKTETLDLLSGADATTAATAFQPSANTPAGGSDLDDLFGFNQPTATKATADPGKVDLFDSMLTDQNFATEKPPVLPSSSSFSQLGALKPDNRSDMAKSTPNLNDMFGDLLSGSEFKPPAAAESYNPRNQGLSAFSNHTNSTLPDDLFMTTDSVPVKPMQPNNTAGAAPTGAKNSSLGNSYSSNFTSGTGVNYRPNNWTGDTSGNSVFGQDSAGSDSKNGTNNGKKLDLNAAFGELLNEQGFTGRSSQSTATKTINEMRRVELAQTKSPEQLRVADWVEGKRKNIRALLATLHTVTWDGCSWKAANMSVMVEPNDVKKVYRKACLAIHPDKQRGEEWEELAKLIFVELNEAYTHFENENFK